MASKVILLLSVWWEVFKAMAYFVIHLFVNEKEKSITGEVVFLTGGAGGIGQELAKLFCNAGAKVAIVDVNTKGAEAIAHELNSAGGTAIAIQCDTTKRDQVKAAIDTVRSELGEITILVNNAGIVKARKLLDAKPEEVVKIFEVNVYSQFWTVMEALPNMLEMNHGHILNVASVAGKAGHVFLTDYAASKFAVVGFTASLRAELRLMKKYGVKTTCVCPYLVHTPLGEPVFQKMSAGEIFNVKAPLKPAEAAQMIMKALLTETVETCIPRELTGQLTFAQMLPVGAQNILGDYLNAGVEI